MIRRMHVAVNCHDLQKSLVFYRSFFNAEPTKVKENYAKFELDEPSLHFSLNVRSFEHKGALNHLGFQVNDTAEVLAMGERLRLANLLTIDEINTTCCYALQDKVWVYDPDGNAWEIFYTKEDSEFESAGEPMDLSLCCVPPSEPVAVVFASFKKKSYQSLVGNKIFFGGASDVESMIKNEKLDMIVDLRGDATESVFPSANTEWIKIPMGDDASVTLENFFKKAMDEVIGAYKSGKKVGFHCNGGTGRAGTVAAGTLLALGICSTVEEAEEKVKNIRPVVNLKEVQKEALIKLFPE